MNTFCELKNCGNKIEKEVIAVDRGMELHRNTSLDILSNVEERFYVAQVTHKHLKVETTDNSGNKKQTTLQTNHQVTTRSRINSLHNIKKWQYQDVDFVK